jgi:hypothetical protein
MNRQMFLVMAVVVAMAFPVRAFAQAAAESALTHALSSSATIKAGSSLNHALNQSSNRLGARIQEQTSIPSQGGARSSNHLHQMQSSVAVTRSGGSAYARSKPAIGAMSIRGGEVTCASPDAGAPAKPGAAASSTRCRTQGRAFESNAEEKYKSFVTLPSPK